MEMHQIYIAIAMKQKYETMGQLAYTIDVRLYYHSCRNFSEGQILGKCRYSNALKTTRIIFGSLMHSYGASTSKSR